MNTLLLLLSASALASVPGPALRGSFHRNDGQGIPSFVQSTVGMPAVSRWVEHADAANATLHAPALDRLPAGATRPAGWLQRQLNLMGLSGATLGLGFWSGGGIAASKWLGTTSNTGGEEQGGGARDILSACRHGW